MTVESDQTSTALERAQIPHVRPSSGNTVVIGCGVVGLTTALELLRRGQGVTLIDAADHEGLGASFANGGLLTPSMPDPWNAPGVHRHLIESLLSSKSALKLRFRALPSLALWGPRFLLNSRPGPYRAATEANFALASYSLSVLRELRMEHALAFDSEDRGTLKIFRSLQTLEGALSVSRNLEPLGLTATAVGCADLSRIEPCLAPIQGQLAGGIFYPGDASGDAHLFCQTMARTIRNLGGEFRYGAVVQSIEVQGGRVRGVRIADETLDAETVVVATGVSSPALVARFGANLAIKPVKGYSMTYTVAADRTMPRVPVIDDAYHAAVTPLGSRLRVAGTAEFAGYNLRLNKGRVGNLSRFFADIYPQLADAQTLATGKPWAGLRPVAADGRPYIGAAAIGGLWVNSGHGHLGWTMAAGSARLLVDLMTGVAPTLDPASYALTR